MAFNRESLELLSMIVNKDRQSDEADKQRAFQGRMQQDQMLHQSYENRVNRISNEIAQSRQSLDAMKNLAVESGLEFGSDSDFESLRTDYSGSLENQIRSGQENINNMRQISEQIRSRLSTARAASEISSKFSESNRYMQSLLGQGDMNPDEAVEELIREYGLNENAYAGNSQDASEEQRMQFREDLKRGFIQGLSDPLSRQQERNAIAQEELARQQQRESANNMRIQNEQIRAQNQGTAVDIDTLMETADRNSMKLNMGMIADYIGIKGNPDPETGEYDEETTAKIEQAVQDVGTNMLYSIEEALGIDFGEDRQRALSIFNQKFLSVLSSPQDRNFTANAGRTIKRFFDNYENNKLENESFPEFVARGLVGDEENEANVQNFEALAYIAAFMNPNVSDDKESAKQSIASAMANAMYVSDLMDFDRTLQVAGTGENSYDAIARHNDEAQRLTQEKQENIEKLTESMDGIDFIHEAYNRRRGIEDENVTTVDEFESGYFERISKNEDNYRTGESDNLSQAETRMFVRQTVNNTVTRIIESSEFIDKSLETRRLTLNEAESQLSVLQESLNVLNSAENKISGSPPRSTQTSGTYGFGIVTTTNIEDEVFSKNKSLAIQKINELRRFIREHRQLSASESN